MSGNSAAFDLYDEESLNATEYALVSMRLGELESRVLELEYLAEFFPRPTRQRELFSIPESP